MVFWFRCTSSPPPPRPKVSRSFLLHCITKNAWLSSLSEHSHSYSVHLLKKKWYVLFGFAKKWAALSAWFNNQIPIPCFQPLLNLYIAIASPFYPSVNPIRPEIPPRWLMLMLMPLAPVNTRTVIIHHRLPRVHKRPPWNAAEPAQCCSCSQVHEQVHSKRLQSCHQLLRYITLTVISTKVHFYQ